MSVESIAAALNLVDDRLTPTMKLVLVGIANHDGDGGAWPSIATLARYAGIQERGLQKAIAQLVELGYVTVHPQQGGSAFTDARYRPNLYELNIHRGVPQDTPHVHRGVLGDVQGVSSRTPEPSLEPSLATSQFADDVTRAAPAPVEKRLDTAVTRYVCDSCGKPVREPGRARHIDCPPPKLPTVAAEAIAEFKRGIIHRPAKQET